MVTVNDFATTYMCQSLPFGGVKHSGFGRFAGVEGLRALCIPVAVCQDRCRPDPVLCFRYSAGTLAATCILGQAGADMCECLELRLLVDCVPLHSEQSGQTGHASSKLIHAVSRVPWLIRTDIPAMLQYPVHDNAQRFVTGLISMFYSVDLAGKTRGLAGVLAAVLGRPQRTKQA